MMPFDFEDLEARDGVAVIPTRRHGKAKTKIDDHTYALRDRIERRFNKLENARMLATRYDKTASRYLGLKNITWIGLRIRSFINKLSPVLWR
jgi:transposase